MGQRRFTTDQIARYLLDRRERYRPSSSTYEAISELAANVLRNDIADRIDHGELEDEDMDRKLISAKRRVRVKP